MAARCLNHPNRSLAAAIMLLLALCALGCQSSAPANTQQVSIASRTFTLELALDGPTRFKGLSDRKEVPETGGMLFVFPEPEVMTFVMRKCHVPIDILFLDPSGRVVQMHEMAVEPYDTPEEKLVRYASQWPAQFAVELRGGTLKTLHVKEGDRVDLPARELIKRAR